ncbi:MAG: FAD-dependent oxidoreductase [Peptococcaceae bacterium]|nr:FAD-dependent oxidoreductase [Peptococcaceae bacterium]
MEFLREEAKRVPIIMKAEVLVCGGGPSGIGAAIGAARAGAKTILVERNSFLGGVATATIMPIFLMDRERLNGFTKELVDELVKQEKAWCGTVINFDPEAFKQVALEKLDHAGVTLLFNTWVSEPIVENGTVKGIFVENKSGRQAILAEKIIDATGDADIAYRAGAPCVFGRETDHKIRPLTINFRIGNIDFEKMLDYCQKHPDQFSPDRFVQVVEPEKKCLRITGFFDLVEEARQNGEVDKDCHYIRFEGIDFKNGVVTVNNVRLYEFDPTNGLDLSKAEIEGRKQISQLVNFIKSKLPGCENAFLIDTSCNIGVRESRRIIGSYILNEADILNNKEIPDRVAMFYRRHNPGQDMHNPDRQEGSKTDLSARQLHRNVYQYEVPYRCFLPQNVDNLLVVGRAMSQNHQADTWTRGMFSMIVIGQAAGIMAAVAAQSGIKLGDIDVASNRSKLSAQNIVFNSGN